MQMRGLVPSVRRKLLTGIGIMAAVLGSVFWLSDTDTEDRHPAKAVAQSRDEEGTGGYFIDPLSSAPQTAPPSDAEKIARLLRGLEKDRKQLTDLDQRLSDPMGEFAKAEAEFKMLDEQVATRDKHILTLKEMGKTTEAAALQEQFKELRMQWQLGRDRFNLAIQERRMLQDKCAALRQKIDQDQKALDRLSGKAEPSAAAPKTAETPKQASTAEEKKADEKKTESASPESKSEPMPIMASPALAAANAVKPTKTAPAASPEKGPPSDEEKAKDRKIQQAQAQAKAKHEQAEQAKSKVESVHQHIDAIQKNIALEKSLAETARKKVEQARETLQGLEEELKRRLVEDPTQIEPLEAKIAEVQKRAEAAKADMRASQDRLNELQTDLRQLSGEQSLLARDADRKKKEADAADQEVKYLQNPYTVRNALQWLVDHAPRVLLVMGILLLLHRLVSLTSRRLVRVMTHSTSKRGTLEERENRAQTLVSVFRNASTIVILGGGSVMLLDTLGIPIVPLMGGAAVVGLAVAFGAQNLIRDYFAGFMVLLENQYGINDVVKIGDIAGKVERITLRMTVLRDQQGTVHFIPHGTITLVSNMTHGHSIALFEIGIAYRENVDRVMQVLLELARNLRRDPVYGSRILEDAEMLGVDALSDSAVILKFLLKTRPLHQWSIRREMLRRIKNRFDELGIEIPYPHRTIYYRPETPAGLEHLTDTDREGAAA